MSYLSTDPEEVMTLNGGNEDPSRQPKFRKSEYGNKMIAQLTAKRSQTSVWGTMNIKMCDFIFMGEQKDNKPCTQRYTGTP